MICGGIKVELQGQENDELYAGVRELMHKRSNFGRPTTNHSADDDCFH